MKNVIADVKKFKGWGKAEELLRKADYKDKEMGKAEKDLKKKNHQQHPSNVSKKEQR